MKKVKFGLVALAIVFAFAGRASKKLDPLYAYDPGDDKIELITTGGDCEPTSLDVYCQYTLRPGHTDNGEIANYQPFTTNEFEIWVPDSK